MPNNTETYWQANGQSLHTYARSIETLSGLGPPTRRGEDVTVPLMPGSRYVPKVPDSNIYTLAMWVRGIAEHASNIDGAATKAQYQKNWNDLIRLLWNSGRQIDLTKRFYDTSSAGVISATARAEYIGGLKPTMMGNNAAKCTVDLKLADPFFYADTVFTTNLVNGSNVISIPGNAPTLNMAFTITGARSNTTIRNLTNGVEFTCPEIITGSDFVTINPQTYDAEYQPSAGAAFDVSTRIIHSGAYQWMQLEPGTNTLQLSSSSGIGVVTLQARGAWV